MRAQLVLVLGTALVRTADAGPAWHAGLEGRAELGLHPIRVVGGVDFGPVDLVGVADPLAAIDGQHDLDLEVSARPGATPWQLFGGLRVTTIALADGATWQEQILAGATAPLPELGHGLRAVFGFELGMFVLKHGGGVPTEWVSWSSGRRFFESYDLGLFLRLEYGSRR